MRTEIFWIDSMPAGRLGIAPRPRGGDWLDDEVEAWRAAGVACVDAGVVHGGVDRNASVTVDRRANVADADAVGAGDEIAAEVHAAALAADEPARAARAAAVVDLRDRARADAGRGLDQAARCGLAVTAGATGGAAHA